MDYLATTFNFQGTAVETALLDFLRHEQTDLFKGPYVHVRLPFRAAVASA